MGVKYVQDGKEVNVAWKENQLGNLELFINGNKTPFEIVVKKTYMPCSSIFANRDGKLYATEHPRMLGNLKKRILSNFYHIKYVIER